MLIKEYRIPLPVSVEEYQIAQLYMVAKISKQETGHGEGIQILENRPYDDENGKGQYTHKILFIGSKLPGWLRSFIPASALQIEEKAWNAYPYCKTVYSVPFLGDRFSISLTTKYLPDGGFMENAFKKSEEELKDRVVDTLDIAYDPIDPSKYKPEEDPTIYLSKKTGRGKLAKDWRDTHKPIMCSYKECAVQLKVWGIQTAGESFIHKVGLRDVFLLGHRQAFCWIDEWFGMTMDDIRKLEDETKAELDKLLIPDGAGAEGAPTNNGEPHADGVAATTTS
jgi:hypothetical protein